MIRRLCNDCKYNDRDGFCNDCGYFYREMTASSVAVSDSGGKSALWKITNADRIRVMTDEELADIFRHLCCPYSLGGNPECTENKAGGGCKGCWLDWLKQEAKK